MALLTLVQAKSHLRITTADDDVDIALKLAQAEATILERCAATSHWAPIVAAWTDVTVPLSVQAAILLLVAHLHEHRGDDDMGIDEALWQALDRLIALNKDPVLA